ncbi:hypothetical protein BAUCODRAFT_35405 [Baudoinia panamericana UAMH 10762]|uniref:LIP-domain-containing protein n=1 Tax=Baudoinia panamericana (strain UAMH 10762) TaxID=717646 RepID=M2MV11_BAUPA|nr:uncharacterized protein BAUCODRAFT_35405 [Baudoinia panamericana UAMH 10762]EMC95418.1 hypothetical protein BAUCODRAFT_35405 [Baudoinia panamericana UAMH 10762]
MLASRRLFQLLLPISLLCFQVYSILLPTQDPFYQPPTGFENRTPGAILRTRRIEASYFGLIPDAVRAYQLLYRTTAINGSAIATVTTIFKRPQAMTDRFISLQCPYDGAAKSGCCQPSYNYRLFAPQDDIINSVDFLSLQALLMDGYIVSSPDYEGPDSAFGAGRLCGMAVLDSMRATAKFWKTLKLTSNKPLIVGYGYSGGAIALGWAASLHALYAPELHVAGWSLGGTPANLTGTLASIDGTLFAGFIPQALVGLSSPSAYGAQLIPVYNRIFTPYGKTILNIATRICGVENLFTFEFKQIQVPSVQTLGTRLLHQPTIAAVLQDSITGLRVNETPIAPVYMYHAMQDEIIPYANASALGRTWCENGASVQFVSVANGGHATAGNLGFAGSLAFITAAFNDTTPKGCTQTTIDNNLLDLAVLGSELEPVLARMLEALAVVGRGDTNIKKDLSRSSRR